MKRYQIYSLRFLVFFAFWAALMYSRDSLFKENLAMHSVINILPIYILMCFGCYCLGKLGYDLLIFRDDPSEIDKLAQVSCSNNLFILN